ncbi:MULTISPECIES: adenylate kinase family protein [Halolamina]|uniref:Putative adenylate kinase n=1 Tax=Halolamina pelagica TaxID=699431 RepID=A0A1I5MX23_9EURY|nr:MULTISPECIES: adenylate kinase family protein [Halolamina]NHX36199.1 AAA family ATPase [Halolamina sp. R1-12]SFP14048.1 adenylate kinase [Halolamina pelagica]
MTDTADDTDLAFDRVALTGTPGTGKSTVAEQVGRRLDVPVHHLNDLIREEGLHEGRDEERGSLIADFDAIDAYLDDWSGLLDSHLAHHFDADAAVVLRCHPDELEERLRERDEPEPTIAENAESEALDIVLSEAVRAYGEGSVYEIDTTDRPVAAVVDDVVAVLRGEREPSAGTVDFTGAL